MNPLDGVDCHGQLELLILNFFYSVLTFIQRSHCPISTALLFYIEGMNLKKKFQLKEKWNYNHFTLFIITTLALTSLQCVFYETLMMFSTRYN